jgi:hypothetical protein
MSNGLNLLTSDLEPETEVKVQETRTMDFYDGYVDEDGIVRYEENGAAFNAGHYALIGER